MSGAERSGDHRHATARGNVAMPRIRFQLIPFEQITLGTAPVYLVSGLLPKVGVAVIWGGPKVGKTFVMYDIGMHVSRGLEYRGRRVKAGMVIYLAAEGSIGFRARTEAYRRERLEPGETPSFNMIDAAPALIKDHGELMKDIRAQIGSEWQPALIVIDTLNRTFTGSESSDADMTAYVNAAHALKTEFHCCVAIVHHSGLDESRMRGHTALLGAADISLSVKRDASNNIVLTVAANKDGPTGDELVSSLSVVEVGRDEDGEVVTSCVVDPVDGPATKSSSNASKGPLLSDRVRLGLDALLDCALTNGQPLPPTYGIPGSQRAVPLSMWRDALFTRGVLDREAKNPREDFRRVKYSLLARKLAGERDGWLWPVTP